MGVMYSVELGSLSFCLLWGNRADRLACIVLHCGSSHFHGLKNDSASSPEQLIVALGRMAGVFNNATQDQARNILTNYYDHALSLTLLMIMHEHANRMQQCRSTDLLRAPDGR
jgi:hypothetical protein